MEKADFIALLAFADLIGGVSALKAIGFDPKIALLWFISLITLTIIGLICDIKKL